MEWYYTLGVISYGIFIIQFLLSLFGFSDTELDVDLDGNTDFSVNDLISFKGLIHFIMGFSGYLMVTQEITAATIAFASVTGLIFVVALYFVYKLCMKLNYEPTAKLGSNLVGNSVVVYVPLKDNKCICTITSPYYMEIICMSDCEVRVGDILIIKEYKNGIYYISK